MFLLDTFLWLSQDGELINGLCNGQDRAKVRSNTEGPVACVCNTISYDLLQYMGAPWRF